MPPYALSLFAVLCLYCVCLINQSVIEDKKYSSITDWSGGKVLEVFKSQGVMIVLKSEMRLDYYGNCISSRVRSSK